MQKKLLIFIMLLSQIAFSKNHDPYVEKLRDKTYLKFPGGKEIIISYPLKYNEGMGEKVRVFMRSGSQLLWDKTFAEDFGTLWHEAYFIPIKKEQFITDLNNDSISEIAIAVWSGEMHHKTPWPLFFLLGIIHLNFLSKNQLRLSLQDSSISELFYV